MPSDSQFAIAMKNQKEAERAEQQRIKNLVLNYDLQDSSVESSTGSTALLYDPFPCPNPNLRVLLSTRNLPFVAPKYVVDRNKNAHTITTSEGANAGEKHQHNASLHQSSPHHTTNSRPVDKSSSNRSGHRARKLQLSDVDWYVIDKSNSLFISRAVFPQSISVGVSVSRDYFMLVFTTLGKLCG